MELKLKIPTHLDELTLKQYQTWAEFVKDNDDLNNLFVKQRMVSIFLGLRFSDVALMRKTDIDDISLHLVNLLNETPEHRLTFKVGQVEFGMIPNLEDISLNEYIDLETGLKDWNSFHSAMAVLYRPITAKVKDKYTIQDYDAKNEYSELMQFMPLGIALGAQLFFYRLLNDLVSCTQNSIIREAVEMHLDYLNNLQKSGRGITQYTHSLKETFEDLKKLVV